MPGDFLKPVTAGQPLRIPAAAYNAFVRTAQAYQANQLPGGAGAPDASPDPHACAYVRNDSGQDVPQFGILALSATMAVSPEDNEPQFRASPTFAGVAPTGDGAPFCITLAPIPAGKCGPALMCGIIPVRLDVADSAHPFADAAPGNVAGLVSAASGPCRILWRGSASGVGWAVVCLNQNANMHEYPFRIWTRFNAEAGCCWELCCSERNPAMSTSGANAGRIGMRGSDGEVSPQVIPVFGWYACQPGVQFLVLRWQNGWEFTLEPQPAERHAYPAGAGEPHDHFFAFTIGKITVAGGVCTVEQWRIGDFDAPAVPSINGVPVITDIQPLGCWATGIRVSAGLLRLSHDAHGICPVVEPNGSYDIML